MNLSEFVLVFVEAVFPVVELVLVSGTLIVAHGTSGDGGIQG